MKNFNKIMCIFAFSQVCSILYIILNYKNFWDIKLFQGQLLLTIMITFIITVSIITWIDTKLYNK